MTETPAPLPPPPPGPPMELIGHSPAPGGLATPPAEDRGLAEPLPFPFLAMVGQHEMRTALMLTMVNPAISGVLLVGPRGTGKTTAVRSLTDLLPLVQRS